MATLESDESNIFDAESFDWKIIIIPVVGILIVGLAVLGYYYHQQNERDQLETAARDAFIAAKTPEEFAKVADQFPGADQSTLALVSAANASFAKRDFAGAIASYQRITSSSATNPELRDAAQVGLASAQEAIGKLDEAIASYLSVAHEGSKSAYAPYAYDSVALLYDQRGDKENERKILTEAAGLSPDSFFVKQAKFKLKALTEAPITVPVPATK